MGTITHDARDRVTQYGTATFTHNDRGQLLTRTVAGVTTTYAYDTLGALRSVSSPSTTVSYRVDALGRRIERSVTGESTTRRWLYVDGLRPVAELDASNAVTAVFVYGHRRIPEFVVRGGTTYRLIADHLGSVRRVVNVATGEVVAAVDYDAFGRALPESDVVGSFAIHPFGFAGGLADPTTNLVRFGVRDYDPSLGRWTATDPILFLGQSANLFAYCANDPINSVDPSGLKEGFFQQFVRSVWEMPTTSVGVLVGLTGSGSDFGVARPGTEANPFVVEFYNNSWVGGRANAVTLGNVVVYGEGRDPEHHRDHEFAHLPQSDALGPFYLPAHLFFRYQSQVICEVRGPSSLPGGDRPGASYNPLEWGPYSNPPRAWY